MQAYESCFKSFLEPLLIVFFLHTDQLTLPFYLTIRIKHCANLISLYGFKIFMVSYTDASGNRFFFQSTFLNKIGEK